jgi:hypothetical protein
MKAVLENMKSNNMNFKVRELTYYKDELIKDYLYDIIFCDLEKAKLFIETAKRVDNCIFDYSDFNCLYVIEVL